MPADDGSSTAREAVLHERARGRLDALMRGTATARGGALVIRGSFGSGRTTMIERAVASSSPSGQVVRVPGVVAESDWDGAALQRLALGLGSVLENSSASADLRRSEAVLSMLTGAAKAGPLVCIADDAQWWDRESLSLLASAGRRLSSEAVALVLTTGAAHPSDPLAGLPEVVLEPLTAMESRALAAQELAIRFELDPGDVPPDVVSAVALLGRGNPLAISELARSLERGQLVNDPLPQGLPAASRLRAHHRELIQALPSAVRQILVLVAAQRRLPLGTLVRAADLAGVEPDAIDRAAEDRLLRLDSAGAATTAELSDDLLTDSVWAEATVVQRLTAHRVLSEVLGDDAALDRAWHAAMAAIGTGRVSNDDLADELHSAARTAAEDGDHGGASLALERAAVLGTVPGTAAERLTDAGRSAWLAGDVRRARQLLIRARRLHSTPELRSAIDLLLGEIELRSGSAGLAYEALTVVADGLAGPSSDQAVSALMRTSEMLMLAGDHPRFLHLAHRLEKIAVPDEKCLTRLVFAGFEGFAASFRGEHRRSLGPLRAVTELAAEAGDPSALILGTIAGITLGDEALTVSLAEQAVQQARGSSDRAELPVALEFLAFAEFLRGQYAPALACAQEGLALSQRAGQDNIVAANLGILALLATIPGDRDAALLRAQAAATRADGRGLCRPRALTIWASARMALAAGRPEGALPALRAAWSSPRPASPAQPHGMHLTIRVMATPDLLEAAVLQGDPHRAATALEIFRAWAEQTASTPNLSLLARCEALTSKDDDQADELFQRSLALRAGRGIDFEQARTQLLYGRALRRRRRPAKARSHLGEAAGVFDAIGARMWAAQARSELRAAGGGIASGPVNELTPQQSQIAHLVAEGATNREIAAQLFLSPRTVDHHLRNIFVRLGVRSRTELARLVS